jgi:hypothetical protein
MLGVHVLGTTFALLGQQGGRLTLYDLRRRGRVKSAAIFGPDEEVFKIFHRVLRGRVQSELLVFGRKSASSPGEDVAASSLWEDVSATLVILEASFDSSSGWNQLFRSGPLGSGDVTVGALFPSQVEETDLAFASGEVFHLDTMPWSLMEVANFNMNLGQILHSFDADGDGLDEIFAAKETAVDTLFLYNS